MFGIYLTKIDDSAEIKISITSKERKKQSIKDTILLKLKELIT